MSFLPLAYPVVFDQPRRLTDIDNWHEHIPFAFFTVAALEPRLVVELGTHKGDSYCAFCQAVQSLALPTRCFAVDTWRGDEQSGAYGPEVLQELRSHHDPLYGSSFSRLLQQTFDEAAEYFTEQSVDLLHIDGCHSYEAVRHDFETWLPKLSDRAVVLLHDTNVRERGFGVWRLWEEIARSHRSFAFAQGHGLGVAAIGEGVDGRFVEFLEAANRDPVAMYFFGALGGRIALPDRERRARADAERRAHAAEEAQLEAKRQASEAQLEAERLVVEAQLEAERLVAEAWLEAERRAEADHQRTHQQLAAAHNDLIDAGEQLRAMRNTVSWRITSPLRSVRRRMRAR
jgi:hypothetical protein